VYSETQQYCAPFFLSGLAVSGPGTMLVEMGTLLGHSSRCMAQGLAAREQAKRNNTLYVAFDYFRLRPGLKTQHTLLRKAMFGGSACKPMPNAKPSAQPDYCYGTAGRRTYDQAVWHDLMVRPVYPGPLQAVPGDIEANAPAFMERVPAGVPVEVWSIDSAKSHAHFVAQARDVWPRLRPGSIIHLVDNLKQQAHFIYSQFVRSGELEVAYIAFGASPWSFVVRAPLNFSKVENFRSSIHTSAEWAEIDREIEALVRRFGRTFRAEPEDVEKTVRLLKLISKQRRLTTTG
jgi:hypothetical protein